MPLGLGQKLAALWKGAGVESPPPPLFPPRPPGPLLWFQASAGESAAALAALAAEMAEEEGDAVLLTGAAAEDFGPAGPPPGVILAPAPDGAAQDLAAFWGHWRPALVVFAGDDLPGPLLAALADLPAPMLLLNARTPALAGTGWALWPGGRRRALGAFAAVLATSAGAAQRLAEAGLPSGKISVAGRVEPALPVLPALDSDRQALAAAIGPRPRWFAAALPAAEETAVLEAHRAAQRLSHRLLLLIAPEDPARAAPLAAWLSAETGLSVRLGALGEGPEEDTDVFIAEGPADYGLFYRLAPITYLGGSLGTGGARRSPMEAAALGSALLHGPYPGAYGAALGRLGAALATRPVTDGGDLAEALSDLLAPDRAARLAAAAWGVVSEGSAARAAARAAIRRLTEGAA